MNHRQKQAQYAAEHRHWRNRLLAVYNDADLATLEAGRLWYPEAEAMIAELSAHYALGRPAVAGVVAALSPQKRWRLNISLAETLLDRRPVASVYASNLIKAEMIADGHPPLDVLGGPKVRAFFANLIGSREIVTVDTWAQKAAIGHLAEAPKRGRYLRLSRAYRAAAAIAGETPREFQAIVWCATRPSTEHAKDTQRMKELFA